MIEPMVSHLDIYPTVCDVLGLTSPDGLEGKSLLPLLDAPDQPLHDALFFEQSWHGHLMPLRSVRTERYRCVRRIGAEEHPACTTTPRNTAAPGDSCRPPGSNAFQMPREQLFDLVHDPQECVNLIDDPACTDVAGRSAAATRATGCTAPTIRPCTNRRTRTTVRPPSDQGCE